MGFDKGNKYGNRFSKENQPKKKNGRKPKLPDLDILLAEVLGETDDKGKTEARTILVMLRTKAKRGDVKAAQLLLDRAYGKAKEAVNTQHTIIVKTDEDEDDDPKMS